MISIRNTGCIQERVKLITLSSLRRIIKSAYIEDLASEGAIISNQAPEGQISTMEVVKFSDNVEGSGDNIESTLCSGLYNKEDDAIAPWSGTDPYAKMN